MSVLNRIVKIARPLRQTAFYGVCRGAYFGWIDYWHRKRLCRYAFENRSHQAKRLCYILSGYKPFLWDTVFPRLRQFIPGDMDVCIVSSGLHNDRLAAIAKDNSWSYLSTSVNQLCFAQNLVVRLHPKADSIYKLDEDIFVTRGVFEGLDRAYAKATADGISVGFVGAQIGLNSCCYINVLQKLGLLEAYERRFGKAMQITNNPVELDPDVAKFFWGGYEESRMFLDIDAVADRFSRMSDSYFLCGIRYSIGMFMITRQIWEEFGGIPVDGCTSGLGRDEEYLLCSTLISHRRVVIAENTYVGHLSFGPQNNAMKEYYQSNKKIFSLKGHDE